VRERGSLSEEWQGRRNKGGRRDEMDKLKHKNCEKQGT
jgi:hypothetical protein